MVQRGYLQAQQTDVYIMLETQGRAVRNVELDLGFGRSVGKSSARIAF